jgi:hypothetical protein
MVKTRNFAEEKKKIRERARAKLKLRKVAKKSNRAENLEDVFTDDSKFVVPVFEEGIGLGGNTVAPTFTPSESIEESVAGVQNTQPLPNRPLYEQNFYEQGRMYTEPGEIRQARSQRIETGASLPIPPSGSEFQPLDMVRTLPENPREKEEREPKLYDIRGMDEEVRGPPGLGEPRNSERSENVTKYRRPDQ